jgi:hypothetical protein
MVGSESMIGSGIWVLSRGIDLEMLSIKSYKHSFLINKSFQKESKKLN